MVGPPMNTTSASTPASTMLMLDSHWMPLATPDTADATKQIVRTTMIATSRLVPTDVHEPARLQPAADLQRAQAERGGRAEEGREDRQDVDGPTERAVGPLLPQNSGMNAELISCAAAAAEGAVGDGQADHRVDRPRVQGPVEQRGGHRDVERLGRPAAAVPGGGEVKCDSGSPTP